jgi:hypothetical protein
MEQSPSRHSSFWKRRTCTLLAVGASTLALILPVWAQNISVFVDGKPVNFSGARPEVQNGRVLVPMADVFRALGAFVDYDAPTRTINAQRGDTQLRLTLGSSVAYINDVPVRLEVPATTRMGRTLVPLRFAGEAFSAQVNYSNGIINITAPPSNPLPNPNPAPTPRPTPAPVIEPPVVNPPVVNPPDDNQTISGPVVRLDAATRTIIVRADNRNQSFEIARNATIERRPVLTTSTADNTRYGTTTRLNLEAIQVGEAVQLELDDANRVSHLTAMPQVTIARIRSAAGNRLVLDDGRNTPVTIGTQVRYINGQGREVSTADLQPGDQVVLFISPETRRIYQVSASPLDVASANGRPVDDVYLPPGDDDNANPNPNNTPPADAPKIDLVSHNARAALRAGASLMITVKGTPGLRGTVDISPRAEGIPLRERNNRPGEYFVNYVIKGNDDVLNGRITAHLTGRDNQDVTEQSLDELTIDTTPPVVNSTDPNDRATVNVAQPNITIIADDLGGSGLAPSTITLTNKGQDIDVPATVTRRGLRAVAPRGLSGRVDVRADVRDEAGNSTIHTFSFTVRGAGNPSIAGPGNDDDFGAITSIYHNANRVLQAGDKLTVTMNAAPGGRASFDLIDQDNRTVATGLTMVENDPGRYSGTYTILRNTAAGELRVVGRFRDQNGQLTTKEATTTVEVVGGNDVTDVTITAPTDIDRVGEEIVVRGTGTPNATVEVNITATGTQFFAFEYREELGTTQVRVNRNGNWQTGTITLPRPRNVKDIRYEIAVTQTDNAGRTSDPVTVSVRAQ